MIFCSFSSVKPEADRVQVFPVLLILNHLIMSSLEYDHVSQEVNLAAASEGFTLCTEYDTFCLLPPWLQVTGSTNTAAAAAAASGLLEESLLFIQL